MNSIQPPPITRALLFLAAMLFVAPGCQAQTGDAGAAGDSAETTRAMTVYHDPNCGCCGKWVGHMRAHGFDVDTVASGEMSRIKHELGVPRELPSCHTAQVGDYIIEGHVPADDVIRLLEEQPEAAGLSVPGMPLGSPGMEVDHRRMAYDVILFRDDGGTEVFNHYEAIE